MFICEMCMAGAKTVQFKATFRYKHVQLEYGYILENNLHLGISHTKRKKKIPD